MRRLLSLALALAFTFTSGSGGGELWRAASPANAAGAGLIHKSAIRTPRSTLDPRRRLPFSKIAGRHVSGRKIAGPRMLDSHGVARVAYNARRALPRSTAATARTASVSSTPVSSGHIIQGRFAGKVALSNVVRSRTDCPLSVVFKGQLAPPVLRGCFCPHAMQRQKNGSLLEIANNACRTVPGQPSIAPAPAFSSHAPVAAAAPGARAVAAPPPAGSVRRGVPAISAAGRAAVTPLTDSRGTPSSASKQYVAAVQADHPIGFYHLDGGGPTAVDSGSNNLPGSVGTNVVRNADPLILGGSAMLFQALTASAADRISVPENIKLEPRSAVSLEYWYSPRAPVVSGSPVMYAGAYGAQISSSAQPAFWLATTSDTGSSLASRTQLLPGATYHIVLTYDGKTRNIFINGRLDTTAPETGQITGYDGTNGLAIGGGFDSTDASVPGTIDEVAIYPQALTPTRVAAHYAARVPQLSKYSASVLRDFPAAYYRLDGSGLDISRNRISAAVGSNVQQNAKPLISDGMAMQFPSGTSAPTTQVDAPADRHLEASAGLTIEYWFSGQSPITPGVDVMYGNAYGAILTSPGQPAFWLQTTNDAGSSLVSPTVLSPGVPYHMVLTYDGKARKIYINGRLDTSAPESGTIVGYDNVTGLGIGGDPAFHDPAAAGTIDEVAVYTYAIPADRIQAHYRSGASRLGGTPAHTIAASSARRGTLGLSGGLLTGALVSDNGTTLTVDAGTGCGSVSVAYSSGTPITTNGFTLTQGTALSIVGTGDCSAFQANSIVLGGPAAPITTITGTIIVNEGPYLVIDGCAGGGWVNAWITGSTAITTNGLTFSAGTPIAVTGPGDCSTSFQANSIVLGNGAASTPPPPPPGTSTLVGTLITNDGNYLVVDGCAGGGFVNAFISSSTQIVTNGLTLSSGTPITVIGTGDCSTAYQASTIILGTSSPPPPPPSTLTGVILTNDGDYLVIDQGCPGGGLVNAFITSSTQIITNGFTLSSGTPVTIVGTGNCSTSYEASTITLGSSAPAPNPTPTTNIIGVPIPGPTPSTLAVVISSPPTTGVNHWWTYEESVIPGVGHAMVNVGNGNLIVQADDMHVPNKGIDLAFRRTYNSQSLHDVVNSDHAGPNIFGNNWTNTFDAHITGNAQGGISVYDIDGARYDYSPGAGGTLVPPAGQFSTLMADNQGGYVWTKKSGTSYHFFSPSQPAASAGFAGRLNQIVARNANCFLQFSYQWAPDASSLANITQMQVQTEAGVAATLSFMQFGSFRLLSSLAWPDGTQITYSYDASGNLVEVDKPSNGPTTTLPLNARPERYGWISTAPHQMMYAAGPRWNLGSGVDGAYQQFAYDQGNRVTQEISTGVVNFTPGDGSGNVLQPSVPTGSQNYLTRSFAYNGAVTSFSDSDGHRTDYGLDGVGRVTTADEFTSATTALRKTTSWDGSNNVSAEIDPRGNETDYSYDANGNTTAVAAPLVQALGFRPTKRYFYDGSNNVRAYCDETRSHSLGIDWPSTQGCANTGGSTLFAYDQPVAPGDTASYQPFGRLMSMTTPLGYTRTLGYPDTSQPGIIDYGLPTSVTGAAIFQPADGTTRQPNITLQYDAFGNILCNSTGSGTWLSQYDKLGRATAHADPDDTSIPGCGKSGTPAMATASYITYFPDGSVAETQTPAQRAATSGITYTYDTDGNQTSETHPIPAGTTTTYTKWYDGSERLVEVRKGWITRYLYDLSAGAGVSVTGTGSFFAHGNLFATLKNGGTSTNPYLETQAIAFDALDRAVTKYRYPNGFLGADTTPAPSTLTYDSSSVTLGLLASQTDERGVVTSYGYDERGAETAISFSDSSAPNRSYSFDAAGHPIQLASQRDGSETRTYDVEGRLTGRIEAASTSGFSSPTTYTYAYFPDGLRSQLSATGSLLTTPLSYSYAYRNDGKRSALRTTLPGTPSVNFGWTYTPAGRQTVQVDDWAAVFDSYDSFGRVLRHTLPVDSFSNIAYDLEDEITSFTSYGGTAVSLGYDSLKELTNQQYASPNGVTFPSETRSYADGALAQDQVLKDPTASPPTTTTGYSSSRRTGASLGSFIAQDPAPDQFGLAAPFDRMGYGYDAGGRNITATHSTSKNQGEPKNPMTVTNVATTTKAFDAENHETGEQTTNSGTRFDLVSNIRTTSTSQGVGVSIAWGLNGHPATVALTNPGQPNVVPYSLHWDNDDLLYVSAPNDFFNNNPLVWYTVEHLAAGDGGSIAVLDRDLSGTYASDHNISGHNSMYLGNVFAPNTTFTAAGTTTATAGYTAPFGLSGGISLANTILPTVRIDGVRVGGITFQGTRTYDESAQQWTTPDAYAGTVHDPMSQRAYMWNGNNPYQYSDPSGYCIGPGIVLLPVCAFAIMHSPEIIETFEGIATGGGPSGGRVGAAAVLARNVERGRQFEDLMRATLGVLKPAHGLRTEFGMRFLDGVSQDGKHGFEFKTAGSLRLSDVGQQIAKDASLLKANVFEDITWVIQSDGRQLSEKTLDALHAAGIRIRLLKQPWEH